MSCSGDLIKVSMWKNPQTTFGEGASVPAALMYVSVLNIPKNFMMCVDIIRTDLCNSCGTSILGSTHHTLVGK